MRLYVLAREEAVMVITRKRINPVGIISIGGVDSGGVPQVLAEHGSALLALTMSDVSKFYPHSACRVPHPMDVWLALEFYAHAREVTERMQLPDPSVIVHCAAGISRSAGIALAIKAKEALARNAHNGDDELTAKEAICNLVADVAHAHAHGFRDDDGIYPNPRIVYHADLILGFHGVLLREYTRRWTTSDLWDRLGEEPYGVFL